MNSRRVITVVELLSPQGVLVHEDVTLRHHIRVNSLPASRLWCCWGRPPAAQTNRSAAIMRGRGPTPRGFFLAHIRTRRASLTRNQQPPKQIYMAHRPEGRLL